MADNPLNAVNRGVYISDNLPFLQSLNDRCIDLVCIDPPFAKNETFGRKNDKSPDPLKPPLTLEEEQAELDLLRRWGITSPEEATVMGIDWPATAYKDFWSWQQDVHSEWIRDIEEDHPGVHKLIEATREIHSDATAAYLCYMAVRLFEIRRVLKDTGNLYLHCDHTAGAYLRQLLDGVFGNGRDGKPGFRNEIAWCYTGASNTTKWFPRKHDTILFYTKPEKSEQLFDRDAVRIPYSESFMGRRRYTDQSKWKGGAARPDSRSTEQVNAQYSAGKVAEDWWTDIPMLIGGERTGYPTQKPVALAERIIKASCPEDGVVLDCFAGCAYVAVAAERLGRSWVACDINPRAWTVFTRQFDKPKLVRLRCAEPAYNHRGRQASFLDETVYVYGPQELPTDAIRVDVDLPPPLPPPPLPVPLDSIFTKDEMLEALLDLSDYQAWCCGFANRMPDGTVKRVVHNFHLDHLDPKSKGGDDEIFNRVPMCPWHNTRKNTRRVYLDDYRQEIADAGELLVNSVADLVDLRWAAGQVREIWFRKRSELSAQTDLQGRSYVVPSGWRRPTSGAVPASPAR